MEEFAAAITTILLEYTMVDTKQNFKFYSYPFHDTHKKDRVDKLMDREREREREPINLPTLELNCNMKNYTRQKQKGKENEKVWYNVLVTNLFRAFFPSLIN